MGGLRFNSQSFVISEKEGLLMQSKTFGYSICNKTSFQINLTYNLYIILSFGVSRLSTINVIQFL